MTRPGDRIEIGPATLYCGDCFDALEAIDDGAADAFITDPPYCSGGFNESGKARAEGQGLRSEILRQIGWFTNDNMTTAGLVHLLRAVCVEAARILVDGGSVCLFTDWRMVPHLAPALESSGLRYQNMVVWDKEHPGLGWGFRPQHEIVLHFTKGTPRFYSKRAGNVIRCRRVHATRKRHQTEKPQDLIAQLVEVTTPAGGLVVDPFMGCGTTGAAAVAAGRRFIGCELAPDHVDTAADRIRAELAAPKLIQDTPPADTAGLFTEEPTE